MSAAREKLACRFLLACVLVIAAAWPFGQAQAEDLQGTVTHVRDGDTIKVDNIPIRLYGLHAPELDSQGGKRAATFMRNLVLHKTVTCSLTGKKNYDRFEGTCWLENADIAGALVAAGLGRDCPRHSGGRYAALELDSAKAMPLPGYCEPR
jgi:endonuclease YncB( thermonuclease family)